MRAVVGRREVFGQPRKRSMGGGFWLGFRGGGMGVKEVAVLPMVRRTIGG